MPIIRGAAPGDAVVTILRSAAQDRTLSYKARGLLVAVMSRPQDWRTDADRLAAESPDGRHAVLTALDELAAAGYLSRRRERQANGQIRTAWEISDQPRWAPNARRAARRQARTGGRFSDVGASDVGASNVGQPDRGSAGVGSPAALLERETEGDTPPPTPAEQGAAQIVDELVVVVEQEIAKKSAPMPGRSVVRAACSRLAADGWTPAQLSAAISAHDWSGARAGAVVAWLRGLAPEDRPSKARRRQERPDWCGSCDEATRLTEDPQTGRQRRCPACHPLSTRRTH